MRWMLEEKVAMMILRSPAIWNSLLNDSPTVRSLGVLPGISMLVESGSSASTPWLPSSPKRPRSMTPPSMGVKSTLKSPVWTMTPAGVWMASAQASGMEWLTRINSTDMQPALMTSPGFTSTIRTWLTRPCSLSLFLISPTVSLVA